MSFVQQQQHDLMASPYCLLVAVLTKELKHRIINNPKNLVNRDLMKPTSVRMHAAIRGGKCPDRG
jgi:hypothetical protein